MKKRFWNSCSQSKFKSQLLLTVLCLLLFTSCKCKRTCEGLDAVTEQLLSPAVKTSILGFPADTHWIFKCVSDPTKVDTIFLEAQEIYPLEKGECALKDGEKCCSDYYYEKSNRGLEVESNSSLNHFTHYFTDEEGLHLKGDWGTILVLNHIYSQDFLQRFNQTLTLTISNRVLNDTRSATQYRDDDTPSTVYWSKQYGLVRYDYASATDTLKYERVGFAAN